MATDSEDLVLSISADVRQMQRALARLTGDTAKTTKAIQQHFNALGDGTAGAFDKVAANSNRAANAVANDAKRMATAMNASRLNTANLAAQLNDIGVQLAAGTSPFQIAIQQGSQINQVLGAGGVRGAVSLLGGAFASLVNPVSLATFAIIGLGGEAVQYFTSLLNDGQQAEEVLKKQASLIEAVAQRWGDAVPAIREYANAVKEAAEAADLQQGRQIIVNEEFEKARDLLPEVRSQIGAVVSEMVRAGAAQADINAVRDSFNALDRAAQDLEATLEAGGDTTEEFKAFTEALAAVLGNDAVSGSNALQTAIYGLRDAYLAAAQAASVLNSQAASTAGLPGRQPRLQPDALSTPEFNGRFGSGVPGGREWKDIFPELFPTERRGRGGGGRASEVERERKAVMELIAALEHEQSLIGLNDVQKRVANETRRAGAAATDEQKQRIAELITAIEAEQEALKASEEAMKALQDIGKDFLSSFINDLRQGKSAAEALEGALARVGEKLLEMALSGLFSGGGLGKGGLFGGLLIPGILHKGGVAGSDGYGHGRRVSPAVFAGARRYHTGCVAGLRPGEVPAILQRGELVIPRGQARSFGGSSVVINAPISAPGADAAQLRRVEQSVQELGRNIPKMVDARTKTAQMRGTRA